MQGRHFNGRAGAALEVDCAAVRADGIVDARGCSVDDLLAPEGPPAHLLQVGPAFARVEASCDVEQRPRQADRIGRRAAEAGAGRELTVDRDAHGQRPRQDGQVQVEERQQGQLASRAAGLRLDAQEPAQESGLGVSQRRGVRSLRAAHLLPQGPQLLQRPRLADVDVGEAEGHRVGGGGDREVSAQVEAECDGALAIHHGVLAVEDHLPRRAHPHLPRPRGVLTRHHQAENSDFTE